MSRKTQTDNENKREQKRKVFIPTWQVRRRNEKASKATTCGVCVVQVCHQEAEAQVGQFDKEESIIAMTTRSCRILHGSVSWLGTLVSTVLTVGIADPIEHWWIVLQSDRGSFYCVQFWNDSVITLHRCESIRQCDLNGLACAAKTTDAHVWEKPQHTYTCNANDDIQSDELDDTNDSKTQTQTQTESETSSDSLYGDTKQSGVWSKHNWSNKTKRKTKRKRMKRSVKLSAIVKWLVSRTFSPEYNLLTHNCQDLCKALLSAHT